MHKVSKYICCILLLFCSLNLYAQTDTTSTDTTTETKPVVKERPDHQLTLSFDITQPIINSYLTYRNGYEFAIDYYFRKELYFVGEAGWGRAKVNDTDLRYTSKNSFFRVGFNKSLLAGISPKDWDMAYIGLRYGMAFIQRSPVSYTIYDNVWGNTTGQIPNGKSFSASWFEIAGGMRVELLKGFFAGYTIRGKFLLTQSAFRELAPIYVAGFGRGDKTAIFDFNFYLSYALRWRNRKVPDVAPAASTESP